MCQLAGGSSHRAGTMLEGRAPQGWDIIRREDFTRSGTVSTGRLVYTGTGTLLEGRTSQRQGQYQLAGGSSQVWDIVGR